jgi:hypothetical protein
MGRWDPRPLDREPGRPDLPTRQFEDIDDVDDQAETLAIASAHVARLDAQLRNAPPADAATLERMRRELRHWQGVIDTTTLDNHWVSGDGDRTLF